jgi:predicted nuclease of restriction endonuclease-like (RecB) superfamily
MATFLLDSQYQNWLKDFKTKIANTQIKAAITINRELILLYFELGKMIVERQLQTNWGDNLIRQIAADLKKEFPDVSGFSRSNLYAIKQFYLFYKDTPEFVQQVAGQIPWGHQSVILQKTKSYDEATFYVKETIADFLLELGKGFAFLGRQYEIEVGKKTYKMDLLFYHTKLHAYVVFELKMGEFEPEYIGKLNFYLSAVDDMLKSESDQPSIGILLCKNKDKIEVEYALRDINKPIGVSEFRFNELPENIKSLMPTVAELENEPLHFQAIQNDDNQ